MTPTRAGKDWGFSLRWAPDSAVRAPMWLYPPEARKRLTTERRRRGFHDLVPDDHYNYELTDPNDDA